MTDYQQFHRRSIEDRDGFWAEQAQLVHWNKPAEQVCDYSKPPFVKWFQDGTLNAAYNAVDRHVEAGNGDRVALYFEGEPGDSASYTYAQLKDEVSKAANAFEASSSPWTQKTSCGCGSSSRSQSSRSEQSACTENSRSW